MSRPAAGWSCQPRPSAAQVLRRMAANRSAAAVLVRGLLLLASPGGVDLGSPVRSADVLLQVGCCRVFPLAQVCPLRLCLRVVLCCCSRCGQADGHAAAA